jgi:hypothetical protein
MTELERVIAYLQEENCKDITPLEHVHINNIAIEALRKHIAMPVNHEKTFWRYYHFCPNCDTEFNREGEKYCSECGQQLDWSNYWEALK